MICDVVFYELKNCSIICATFFENLKFG